MLFRSKRPTSTAVREVAARPTQAEQKVRAALAVVEQAAQASASRTTGLDTKASILLVVASIIITSSFSGDGLIYRIAALLAFASAFLALVSLWPRGVGGVHPTTVTDHLTSHRETLQQFEHWLLALQKAAAIEREQYIERRAKQLIIGFSLAVAAMLCAAISLIHDGNWLALWIHTVQNGVGQHQPTSTPSMRHD